LGKDRQLFLNGDVKKMKRIFLFSVFFIAFLSCLWSEEASDAKSKEKYRKISLRVNMQYESSLTGKAGSGTNPPGYKDVFRPGLGGGFEIGFSVLPNHQAIIGIEDKTWDGKDFEEVMFSGRKSTVVYASWKMNILSNRDSSKKPYLRVDIGAASLSTVEITYYTIRNNYWDSSWVPMIRAGVGIELILIDWTAYSNGIFLDVKFQYLGKPPSLMSPYSDAGGSWSIPVSIGLSFNL
jgi:hypothetical protein